MLTALLMFGLAWAKIFKHSSPHSQTGEKTKEFGCVRDCAFGCKLSEDALLLFECFSTCHQQCRNQETISEESAVKDLPKNYCLNQKDPLKLSYKENLIEFAKGPCSPIVLVPGLFASRFVMEIDCEVLKELQPDTFAVCGWNTCEKKWWQFWKHIPKKEYQVWIPELFTPFSIFTFSKKANLCFAKLISNDFDFTKPVEQMVLRVPGVTLKPFGFTAETKMYNKCGANSLNDLLPFFYQIRDTEGFRRNFNALEHLGYRSGLTMQAMPYNFLISYRNNEFGLNFKNILNRMRKITGKKSTIFAHSLGNINVLHQLALMAQEEKDNLVANWIIVSAPLLGAHKANKDILSGLDDFTHFHNLMGLDFAAAVVLAASHTTTYELSFKDPFVYYQNDTYFQSIVKRLNYEKNFPKIPFENSGISFWPKYNESCHEKQITNIKSNCFLGIFNTSETPVFTLENKTFYSDQLYEVYQTFNLSLNTPILFDKLSADSLLYVDPGVPVVNIFSSSVPTPVYFHYQKGFWNYVEKKQFPPVVEEGVVPGDETVATISAITMPLRWALKFEDKPKEVSSKPVKFVEICSSANQGRSIYDKKDSQAEFQILKNDYIGTPCECSNRKLKDFDPCHHSMTLNDLNVLKIMVDVMVGNQKVTEKDFDTINKLDEEILRDEVLNCTHYVPFNN